MDPINKKRSGLIPGKQEIAAALGTFSPIERFVFLWAMGVAVIAVLVIIFSINQHFMTSVPAAGGTLREGIVGTPRFINPVLAASDADRDLTALTYQGLMKKDASGALVPDLAASYTVSDDKRTYTFVLRDGSTFQDGSPLTTSDVAFTAQAAADPALKSAHLIEWEGVTVTVIDQKTIAFVLKEPYAPFLESTTLGILPKNIWGKIPYDAWAYSNLNTSKTIGSGEWKIRKVTTDSTGVPTMYTLAAVHVATSAGPLISTIKIKIYPGTEELMAAFENGDLDTLGGINTLAAQELANRGATISQSTLPRVFGIFFNQQKAPIFADTSVRRAINMAVDKQAIVTGVLHGYGKTIDGPIVPASGEAAPRDVAGAKALLEKNGWTLGDDGIYTKDGARLSFELATSDVPELGDATRAISAQLHEAGIEAVVKVYEAGTLNQNVIRPRKFQALFFGEIVNDQSDLYAFWHSSQRTGTGLNISQYANPSVDALLQSALATSDPAALHDLYADLESTLQSDMPAVFVYAPSYIYVTRHDLPGITLPRITSPEDRFAGIDSWYLDTDHVWKIFLKKQ